MTALQFPATPTLNQTYTGPNGVLYKWDGEKWTGDIPPTIIIGPTGPTGATGATGARGEQGGMNYQEFLTSGTFTVPAGVTKIVATLYGGGGGGQGGSGAAGGSGGYGVALITVTPGSSISITVGSGGGGAAPGVGSAGGTGGTTTVGSFATATGGAGAPWNGGNGSSGTFSVANGAIRINYTPIFGGPAGIGVLELTQTGGGQIGEGEWEPVSAFYGTGGGGYHTGGATSMNQINLTLTPISPPSFGNRQRGAASFQQYPGAGGGPNGGATGGTWGGGGGGGGGVVIEW